MSARRPVPPARTEAHGNALCGTAPRYNFNTLSKQ